MGWFFPKTCIFPVQISRGPHGITYLLPMGRRSFPMSSVACHMGTEVLWGYLVWKRPFLMGFTCGRTPTHVTNMRWTLSHGRSVYFPWDVLIFYPCERQSHVRVFFPVWNIFPCETYSLGKGFPGRKVTSEIFFNAMYIKKEDSHSIISYYCDYYTVRQKKNI